MALPKNLKIYLIFLATALAFNFGHLLNSDEGTVLNSAWKMHKGEVLYKDFDSIAAPGSSIWTKFSFHILGPSYYSAKIFSLILLLLSAYAMYKLTYLSTKNRNFSKICAWLWLLTISLGYPIINYNSHSTYLAIIAIYFFIKSQIFKSKKDFFLSGFLIGSTIVFLQHKGIILAGSIFLLSIYYFLAQKIRLSHLILIASGALILPVSIISYWGPTFLFQKLIISPLKINIIANFLPLKELLIILLFFPPALIWVWKRFPDFNKDALIVIAITQLALLAAIFARLDINHFLLNSYGFLIIFSYLIYQIVKSQHFLKTAITQHKFFLGFIVVLITFGFPLTINFSSFYILSKIKEKIALHNIKQFYAHPFLPGFYFEFSSENPYPHDILISTMHPKEYFEQNLNVLKTQNPRHVITNYGMVKKFNYDVDNPLDNYISTNYNQIADYGGLVFMEKINSK